MSFYKHDSIDSLNDSKEEWSLRVRAQSIWKGITRQTGEFRGYNIVFFDDYVSNLYMFQSLFCTPFSLITKTFQFVLQMKTSMQCSRIHAFITAPIVPQFEEKLEEGQIYIIENFQVKEYLGDETNRAVRNKKHLFFTSDTKLEKHTVESLKSKHIDLIFLILRRWTQ